MTSYTHAGMLAELAAIAERAQHVRVDRRQLARVAGIMRSRVHLDDIPVPRDSPDLEPAALLQFYLVAGAHNFLIWQRDDTGAVRPWSAYISGEQRFGAPAISACHIRALREGRNILDPDYLSSMTLTDHGTGRWWTCRTRNRSRWERTTIARSSSTGSACCGSAKSSDSG